MTASKMVASNKYTAPKEDATAIVVPTTTDDTSLNPAHDREIDLRQMDEQDVKALQKSGKYHSEVLSRAACRTGKEVTSETDSSHFVFSLSSRNLRLFFLFT
jgi:hypothetical protein